MDRRTDRTVGLLTIITMAVVPAAVLGLVKTSAAFDGGRAIEAGPSPESEDYPGAPKKPKQAQQAQTPAGTLPAAPAAPPVSNPAQTGPLPAELTSFTRQTGTVVAKAAGTEQTQETADFTLKPKFSMTSTSVKSTLKGKKWKTVSRTVVTIKNGVRTTKVGGQPAERETLTSAQLAKLKQQADPRYLTRQIKKLPVKPKYDEKSKMWTYTLDLTAGGNILPFLPADIAALVPTAAGMLGLTIADYADAKDHTYVASFTGATVMGATGIGVIFSNMK